MAENEEVKNGQSSNNSTAKLDKIDHKLQYEEVTTFSSDPIPKAGTFARSSTDDSDEDGQLFKKNPFLDPDVAEHWTAVYEKSRYESRKEFDPTLQWTEAEERKLVWKLDWHVCFWAVRILERREIRALF